MKKHTNHKDIKTTINLESTFRLIQELKQGIKQKCCVEIADSSVRGLCIRIRTKNYKTKEFMYFQRIITEDELIMASEGLHSIIINHTINEANDFFRKEQTNDNIR
jgi:sugar-specific transcriptional regulator TrmB